jgi:predicted RNA-binding Zn ribbon-like protein
MVMPATPADPAAIALQAVPGEATCLDYANTRMWRGATTPVEQLGALPDLLDWIASVAGLSADVVGALRGWADTHPDQAAPLFSAAIALRELVYRVFRAIAAGAATADADLTALNRALAEAPPRVALARLGGGYAWRTDDAALSAPALLAPILWSAGDLLVQAPHRRIRQCANPECLWLFIDASKNGTRRWCDMAACGNRAKARRHYLKSKQTVRLPRNRAPE